MIYVVVAWMLLQVADVVAPAAGLPEWTVTFVLVVSGLGFPLALVLAWALEVTPDGVKRTPDPTLATDVRRLRPPDPRRCLGGAAGFLAAPIMALLVLGNGCSCRPPTGPRAAVHDSAGVSVVQYSKAVLDSAPKVNFRLDPTWSLPPTVGEPPRRPRRITDALMRAERLWILDGEAGAIWQFNVYREALHRAALGAGSRVVDLDDPGYPSRLWLRRDSLVVWDRGSRRLTWLDREGSVGRAANVPSVSRVAAVFGDGRFVASSLRFLRPTPGVLQAVLHLTLHSPDGRVVDLLGSYPAGHVETARDTVVQVTRAELSGPRTLVAGSEHWWVLTTGEEPEVEVRAPTGELMQLIRWDPAGSRAPDSALVTRLLVDSRDRVWVEVSPERPGWERWLVFDVEDRWGDDVTFPSRLARSGHPTSNFRVPHRPDWALSSWSDEEGGQPIGFHEVREESPRNPCRGSNFGIGM